MVKNSIIAASTILLLILIFSISASKTQEHCCHFKLNSQRKTNFDLQKGHEFYKKNYMTKDGRIMDPMKDNITTSEGQSYMLMRSALMKDRKTFDLVYTWTKNNLSREDGLFAWLWGRNKDGQYKIIDNNSAADADVDIADSLIYAYGQWKDEKYLKAAIPIINSIWDNETKLVGGYRILMPGVEQTKSDIIEVNPSYFSPYFFKAFNKYDKLHDWSQLVDSSYYYLNAVMAKTETGLPPNWFLIEDGQIVIEDSKRGDFSYDAIRVFTRIYYDYAKTGDKRALPILEKSNFFIEQWKKTKTIYTNYKANGQLRDKDKFVGSIANLLPAMYLFDKEVTAEIYNSELAPCFEKKGYWDIKKEYYGKNLIWFGCYLYNNAVLNDEK